MTITEATQNVRRTRASTTPVDPRSWCRGLRSMGGGGGSRGPQRQWPRASLQHDDEGSPSCPPQPNSSPIPLSTKARRLPPLPSSRPRPAFCPSPRASGGFRRALRCRCPGLWPGAVLAVRAAAARRFRPVLPPERANRQALGRAHQQGGKEARDAAGQQGRGPTRTGRRRAGGSEGGTKARSRGGPPERPGGSTTAGGGLWRRWKRQTPWRWAGSAAVCYAPTRTIGRPLEPRPFEFLGAPMANDGPKGDR
jgi:hypothetical protein